MSKNKKKFCQDGVNAAYWTARKALLDFDEALGNHLDDLNDDDCYYHYHQSFIDDVEKRGDYEEDK